MSMMASEQMGAPMVGPPTGGPLGPPDTAQTQGDTLELLRQALTLVRQATDAEPDPGMSLQLEKITTLIQQALAQDHTDTFKAIGMDPGVARVMAR